MSKMGCLRVLVTVGFPVVQFNPVQQPFMVFSIVPIPDGLRLAKQPFVGAKEIDDQSLIAPTVPRPSIRLQCRARSRWAVVREWLCWLGYILREIVDPGTKWEHSHGGVGYR
jgi:hypothetical protein